MLTAVYVQTTHPMIAHIPRILSRSLQPIAHLREGATGHAAQIDYISL